MRFRSARRALALLLLLAFVGSSLGVPVFDAFAHHRGHAEQAVGPHFESSDEGGCHAERCLLGLAWSVPRHVWQVASGAIVLPETRILPITSPEIIWWSGVTIHTSTLSRAPPSFLV